MFLCVLCAVTCQRRSYSTFLTLTVWLLTAQDLLLLDSGEEEEEEEEIGGRREGRERFAADRIGKKLQTERRNLGQECLLFPSLCVALS